MEDVGVGRGCRRCVDQCTSRITTLGHGGAKFVANRLLTFNNVLTFLVYCFTLSKSARGCLLKTILYLVTCLKVEQLSSGGGRGVRRLSTLLGICRSRVGT